MTKLRKYDPSVWEAIQSLRSRLDSDEEMSGSLTKLVNALLTDQMIPSMGNKAAYKRHYEGHQDKGVHVHADLNDFGQINKLHGHEAGDQAIKSFGALANQLSRKHGGKSFRVGGDEFRFHFNDPDTAHTFTRELQRQLSAYPKVGGTHNLAASIGLGRNLDEAENSVMRAKSMLGSMDETGKRINTHEIGNAPTTVFSAFSEIEDLNKEEGLSKARPGPKFPKLGFGDDRRETPYVKPGSLEHTNKLRLIHSDSTRLPGAKKLNYPEREVFVAEKAPGAMGAVAPARQTGFARDGRLSTKLHEDTHLMFGRIREKYGPHASHAAARHLIDSLPSHLKGSVRGTIDKWYGNTNKSLMPEEEYVTSMVSLLNDSKDKNYILNRLQRFSPEAEKRGMVQLRDQMLKQAYKRIINEAKTIDENKLEEIKTKYPLPSSPYKTLFERETQKSEKAIEKLRKSPLVWDDDENPKSVYRVENDKGQGPYFVGSPKVDEALGKVRGLNLRNQLLPEYDFPKREWSRRANKKDFKFAFPSEEAARRWFGEQALEELSGLGFKLKPIPARKVYQSKSGNQVIFLPSQTKLTKDALDPNSEVWVMANTNSLEKKEGFVTKTLYHGTQVPFAEFQPPTHGMEENAIWFTDSEDDAEQFATNYFFKKKGIKTDVPRVIESRVQLRNPYIVNFKGEVYDPESIERTLKEARQEGHDGVVFQRIQNFEHGEPSTSYAVFDPKGVEILGSRVLHKSLSKDLAKMAIADIEAETKPSGEYIDPIIKDTAPAYGTRL